MNISIQFVFYRLENNNQTRVLLTGLVRLENTFKTFYLIYAYIDNFIVLLYFVEKQVPSHNLSFKWMPIPTDEHTKIDLVIDSDQE